MNAFCAYHCPHTHTVLDHLLDLAILIGTLPTRFRYMGVTAIKKDVIVLLDTGNTMGDLLPGDLLDSADITKLNASLSVVNELLDTFAYGDRVTVITFTNSGARTVLSPVSMYSEYE